MRVGVEQSVHQHHLHIDLDEGRHKRLDVHVGRVEPVDAGPVHELHHEHALAREVVHDLGDMYAVVVREVSPDLGAVLGFEAKVHLLVHPVGELLDHRSRAAHVDVVPVTGDPPENAAGGAQVGLDECFHAGAEHFHGDVAPLPAGAMHLAERRGGDGLAVERLEERCRAHPIGHQDLALDRIGRDRWHLVVQRAELADVRLGDEV